nr:reverse transcriptase domain-containing protein [Tanacetum cinerariifolium]
MKIDQHHFNAESDLIESMLNHDSYIIPSSSKIDSLLTLLKSIPLGIDETDYYSEEDNRFIERLFNPSSNPTPFTNPDPKASNRRRSKQRIEDFNLEELSPPIVTMADQRTMAQLLEAPIEGYEDAIVVPAITADNFELKHGLLTLPSLRASPKVRYSRNKPVVAKVSTNASTFGISPDVAELKDMVKALLLDKKSQSPAPVKAVEESCVTCG